MLMLILPRQGSVWGKFTRLDISEITNMFVMLRLHLINHCLYVTQDGNCLIGLVNYSSNRCSDTFPWD